MTETKTGNGGRTIAVASITCPHENESHENINFAAVPRPCEQRGIGCISQNGYMCLHSGPCQPVDSNGDLFVVVSSILDGHRVNSRRFVAVRAQADIIDAEEANAALMMVEQLKGRVA